MKGKLILALGTLLVLSFMFGGCDDGNDNSNGSNSFVGTWTQDGSGGAVKVVVTATNWTASYNNSTYNAGTYTYENTTAIWTITNKGIGTADVGDTGTATIVSGKMYLANFSDLNMNGTYSK